MSIRITDDQGCDSISNPAGVRELYRQRRQSSKQGNSPDLADKTNKKSLVEFLREPSPEYKLHDVQDARRDDEKISFECIEP